MARAWCAAGRPSWSGRPLGSFEHWCRIVGGALEHAGVEDFLGNTDSLYEQADEETQQWIAFFSAWDATFGDRPVKDPPYGVSYADKNAFLNAADKGNRIQTEIENDHMSLEDTAKLWSAAFRAWASHFGDHSAYYVCTASSNGLLPLMLDTMQKAGMPYRHQLIWAKNVHVLGRSDYCYKHEPLLYGWAKRHKFYGGGEQKFSVWEYPKPTANKLHPTMKPVALIENAILNSTDKGMLVADPFLGSGSTLIAAERTGRVCIGSELEPRYCDVIRKRWSEHVYGPDCDWLTNAPCL